MKKMKDSGAALRTIKMNDGDMLTHAETLDE